MNNLPSSPDHASQTSTDWSTDGIIERRDTFYAASQRAFVPYEEPMIFKSGKGQYLWDEAGKRYLDLLGMNVCISVGHCHPTVNRAVHEQIEQSREKSKAYWLLTYFLKLSLKPSSLLNSL